MAGNTYGYQYETSPRKLEPSYDYPKKNKKKNYTKVKKSNNTVAKASNEQTKRRVKIVFGIFCVFTILLAMGYQRSLITESFNNKEQLKKDLGAIQKENEQLQVNIENNLNLNNIEKSAKELLGMQKLDNNQKVYINLPKKDYVSSSVNNDNSSEGYSVWNKIKKIFK